MKVAFYARVSTKDKGQSTENQLPELHRFAEAHGYTVYKEYVDEESGGTGNRPGFKALFADAHRKRFDSVLFWSLDRFSREGSCETMNYLNQLESYGVGYKSLTEQYLDMHLPGGCCFYPGDGGQAGAGAANTPPFSALKCPSCSSYSA